MRKLVYILSMASCALSQGNRAQFPFHPPEPLVRYASAFPGVDLGDQVNAAYADLPSSGGAIMVTESGSFTTPIVFGTRNKPVRAHWPPWRHRHHDLHRD